MQDLLTDWIYGTREKNMSEMTPRFLVCTLNGWRYHSPLESIGSGGEDKITSLVLDMMCVMCL